MDNLQQYFNNLKAPTLKATYDATISSSTSLTLQAGTTTLQVSAVDKGIFLAWGRTASSSDFDEFISPGTTRTYVRPKNPLTGAPYTTVEFIEQSSAAILVVIEK